MTVDLSKFNLPCFVKLRNGRKVWCMKNPYDNDYVALSLDGNTKWYNMYGKLLHSAPDDPDDIISEWQEPPPKPSSLEYEVYEHKDGRRRLQQADLPYAPVESWKLIDRGVWTEGEDK
jgi:hypothetical protein